jgi:hypothetical protein
MLVTEGVSLRNRILLMIGNGPSSWWLTPKVVSDARERWPSLAVAACNQTALLLSADIGGAVDRMSMEQLLALGFYHRATLCFEQEVFLSILRDAGEAPAGLEDGSNLFLFPKEYANFGTGSALACSLAWCNPSAMMLIGFDGSADERTRWTGSPGYKASPSNGNVMDQWMIHMAGNIAGAIEGGYCGSVATPVLLAHQAISHGRRYPLLPLADVRPVRKISTAAKTAFSQIEAWVNENVSKPVPERPTCPS